MKIQKILVPVDFSAHSSKAREYAVEIAKAFDAEVHLVHAQGTPLLVGNMYGYQVPGDLIEEVRRVAGERLDEEVEKLRPHVKAGATLSAGSPAEAICETAEQLGADLIVMGTHGHSGVMRALLGSVAERTLRNAPCPVLTVRAADA